MNVTISERGVVQSGAALFCISLSEHFTLQKLGDCVVHWSASKSHGVRTPLTIIG